MPRWGSVSKVVKVQISNVPHDDEVIVEDILKDQFAGVRFYPETTRGRRVFVAELQLNEFDDEQNWIVDIQDELNKEDNNIGIPGQEIIVRKHQEKRKTPSRSRDRRRMSVPRNQYRGRNRRNTTASHAGFTSRKYYGDRGAQRRQSRARRFSAPAMMLTPRGGWDDGLGFYDDYKRSSSSGKSCCPNGAAPGLTVKQCSFGITVMLVALALNGMAATMGMCGEGEKCVQPLSPPTMLSCLLNWENCKHWKARVVKLEIQLANSTLLIPHSQEEMLRKMNDTALRKELGCDANGHACTQLPIKYRSWEVQPKSKPRMPRGKPGMKEELLFIDRRPAGGHDIYVRELNPQGISAFRNETNRVRIGITKEQRMKYFSKLPDASSPQLKHLSRTPPPPDKYVLASAGSRDCGSKGAVTTATECAEAAAYFGTQFHKTETTNLWPRFCYRYDMQGQFHFNEHPTGSPSVNEVGFPVCLGEESIPTPTNTTFSWLRPWTWQRQIQVDGLGRIPEASILAL